MRIVFIGTGEIGVPTLRVSSHSTEHELVGVVTQPDKPVGRDQQIDRARRSKPRWSRRPFRFCNRSGSNAGSGRANSGAGSRMSSSSWPTDKFLPRAVLEIPRIACLNLHASLLPRYRGAAPIQAAIAAGDTRNRHHRHVHG